MTLRKVLKKIKGDQKVHIVNPITRTIIFRGLASDIKLHTYLYSDYDVVCIGSESGINAVFLYVVGGPRDE